MAFFTANNNRKGEGQNLTSAWDLKMFGMCISITITHLIIRLTK